MKKKKTTSNPKKQVNKSQKKGKKLGGVGPSSQDCMDFLR
jgi:hypothetical protein